MAGGFQFFEQHDEWLVNYTARQTEYEALLKKHGDEVKSLGEVQGAALRKLTEEQKSALAELNGLFTKEIDISAEALKQVAPVSRDDIKNIPGRRAAYSDRMAALLAKFALLAYIKFEDEGKKLILEKTLDHGEVKLIDAYKNTDTDTEYVIGEAPEFVIVAFRGTQEQADRAIDKSIYTKMTEVEGFKGRVRVHDGFLRAFLSIEQELAQTLAETGTKPIYLTGHSLGGALAIVASAVYGGTNTLGERIAAVYSFGAPRVGDKDFADIVKAPHYRVINEGDAIPMVPPNWMSGYAHTGTPVLLKKDKMRPIKSAPWGSALITLVVSILLWPFARQLLVRAAHDISLYATRLERIAKYRGSWT